MKTQFLLDRLGRMPMLKAFMPFAAGIVLADSFTLPLWFAAGVFVCAGVAALLFRSWVYAVVMLLIAGFGIAQLSRTEPSVPREVPTLFELIIEGVPADRGRYTSAEGCITAWRDPSTGHWFPARDRVVVRADSLTTLCGGDRLRIRGVVRPFRSGAESYRALMQRRGYAGTLNVSQRTLLERLPGHENPLHLRAAARMSNLGIPGDAGAVIRAMTAGDRSGITPELRTAYSRSGLSHLLAVSGLHTGIVFVLINALLWWMPLLRRGHLLRNVVAALCIWLFVAAAGFPPSAVRAAVMCTFLQFALASASEYSGMNVLAAAAFGMLLYNPAWIGDISFQLSFAAVAGILAWGVPLCRRLHTRYRALNAVVDAFAVSFAATLATAPLVSHAFGITPVFGLLVNPLAILMATVAVFAGVLWLVIPFDFLAPVLRFVAEHTAQGVNWLARTAASSPSGTIEYTLSTTQTTVIYLLLTAATVAVWCAEPKKSVHLPA